MYYRCCVDNCASKRQGVKMHQFPASETGLQKWLQCINSDRLRNLSIQELRKVFVCHKHFERRFITEKSRIRLGAYPTLFTEEEINSGVPSIIHEADIIRHMTLDHYYERPQHEDHSYTKVGPSSEATTAGPLEQPSVSPKHPTTPDLSVDNSRILREIQNIPQTSTMSVPSVILSPVARQTQDLTQASQVSGPKQPHIPKELHTQSDQPNESDPSLILSTVARQAQDLPQASEVSGVTTDTSTRKRKRRRRMMRKLADLSPSCRDIYFEYKKSVKQLDFIRRAKRCIKFSKTEAFKNLTANVNPLATQLMWMQITQSRKKLKGRRFTYDEKMISLAIMKQSPKAYRFLQKIFILPSRNTLLKMSTQLNVQPGINSQIFDAIKDQVQQWKENRKYCSIIFDEMKLETGLEPDKTRDHINGFVHLNEKKNDFADHALAFMVRGAIQKWQQPVAFYFCEGATNKFDLKVIIKDIVSAVIGTGLVPVAIICDQGQSFQSALNALAEDTRRDQIKAGKQIDDVITINGQDLNVFFDPPHLIKGIRNNLLTKALKFENKMCKWSDIVDVYTTDCGHAETRLLHKLNDTHVIPEKIKKMKVKNCTRVLSQTVASALSYTSQFSHYADGRRVSETIKNTAEAVAFFDNLFDSVNGASLSDKIARGKILKKAVTETSPHHEFWRDAIKKLENNSDPSECTKRTCYKKILKLLNILHTKRNLITT